MRSGATERKRGGGWRGAAGYGVWLLVLGTVSPVAAAQARRSGGDSLEAVHLLRRATFGIRSGDVGAVLSQGRVAWLERQLNPERIADSAMVLRLSAFPLAGASASELIRDFNPPPAQPGDTMMTAEQRRQRQQQNPQRILADLVGAKLVRSVWTERQLEEVMTDFWYNHFNVVFNKGLDRFFVSDYERGAIRPHVFGKFETMVRATAQHPAMLFYLDNWTSSVPDSMNEALMARRRVQPGAAAPRGARGINENYARELMELHTLGVDGGYTQQDVIEVARALTGWTFTRPGQRGARRAAQAGRASEGEEVRFVFNPVMHDRGEKVVLGRRLAAGRGIEDGLDVIHLLATHPSTARHIATKLIERFVTDGADPEFVAELAAVFTRTEGDLREVTRALFTSRRFYASANVGTKIKTPFELVASAMRATSSEIGPSRPLLETLRGLGQLPYTESAPTGFPAASEEWVNSGAMLARMNFGLNLASGRIQGIRPAPAASRAQDRPADALAEMLGRLMPGMETTALSQSILADLTASQADSPPRARAARALGLALGSPEFQRK